MPDQPFAFHITFGTYGTRLHGDERRTVERPHNQFGEPIVGRDDEWERLERNTLNFNPVYFTLEQRLFVEERIESMCPSCGWRYHLTACQPDHVHTMLSTDFAPKPVRRLLKRKLGQELSEKWPIPTDATWWAEGGSIKWIWDERYFQNVYNYILAQRTSLPRGGTPRL